MLLFKYNSFGQLASEYQEHSGAVNILTTPQVQYAYADGAANHVRPVSLTYPDGRTLHYDYGAANGIDDAASRVAALVDDDGLTHLADYRYLGQGTVVEVDYPEPELKYTLVDLLLSDDPDTGGIYMGLDRFGWVKDSRWRNYGSSVDTERIRYGYDRAGNRLWRENLVTDSHGGGYDELYTYDGLHRLADLQRGDLSSTKDAITSKTFAEAWTLDPTGNWAGFKQDADGDAVWELDQARSANPVNEITNISKTAGPSWATPAYDRAGNMTTIPQPADPTQSYAATWDAWNRLVQLEDGVNTVAEYAYDDRNFRLTKSISGTTRHCYYRSRWQCLEERLDSSSSADRQFVWGMRYVDELVLRERDTAANGTLEERLYALQDGNWNVTALCDETGSVQERYAYTAYGTPTVLEASFAGRSASPYDWETCYAGYRWDAESEMQHVRWRHLHAVLGKWVSRDPIGYAGDASNLINYVSKSRYPLRYFAGYNLYRYAGGRPTVLLDPSGLLEVNVPCNLPTTGRNQIYLSFDDCSATQQAEIAARMCDAAKAADLAWFEVSLANQFFGKGPPVLKQHQHIVDKVMPCLNKWFGEPGPPSHVGHKVKTVGHISKEHLQVVATTLAKSSPFEKRINIECECGDCWSSKAYVYRNRVFGYRFSTHIHLCDGWFREQGDANKSAILLHELSHLYGDTVDHAYGSSSGIADFAPTYDVDGEYLSADLLVNNAATYEGFFKCVYLK